MNLMVRMERGLVHAWTSTGRIAAFVGVCLFAVAGFAAESISITATPRYPWNGKVDLKFTIDGTSGTKYDTSFTAKDMVGGTNVAMKTIRKSNGVAAEEKEKLLPGTYNWVWDAAADLPKDFKCERMTVTGNAEQSQGLYMVIDLSSGANSSKYPVSYLDAVPSGGWSDEYKTTKLVLRKIEPGVFMMQGNRQVTLTKGFYIGVFEATQSQFVQIKGFNPAYYMKADQLPAIDVSYNEAVECVTALATKTGLSFSLPTEAQWEYACRAGTTTAYNNGGNLESDLKAVGRYSGNYKDGKVECLLYYYDIYLAMVGQYLPNKWGIYDMHGNAQEWVMDWSGSLGTQAVIDPSGPVTGTTRVQRGGAACMSSEQCTSLSRRSYDPAEKCMWYYMGSTDVSFGFRVCVNNQL